MADIVTRAQHSAEQARPFAVAERQLLLRNRVPATGRFRGGGSRGSGAPDGRHAGRGEAATGAVPRIGPDDAFGGGSRRASEVHASRRDARGARRDTRAARRGLTRALGGTTLGDLTELALVSGMSQGEILALSVEHLDVDRGRVRVEWVIDSGGHQATLARPHAPDGGRLVRLDTAVLRRLRRRATQALGRPACVAPDGGELHLLFARHDGTPMGAGAVAAFWRELVRDRAGEFGFAPRVRHRDVEKTYVQVLLSRRHGR